MGSRIGTRGVLLDDVLWVDLVEIAAGHLTRLALARRLAAGRARRDAAQHAEAEVVAADRGLRCAPARVRLASQHQRARRRAQRAHRGRSADGAPCMLVGHSMGGVVARRRARASGVATHRARRAARRAEPRLVRAGAGVARRLPDACASSRPSTAATARRTSRGSCSARCRRCTNCCPIRALAGGANLFDAKSMAGRRRCDPTRATAWPRRSGTGRWPAARRALPAHRRRATGHRDVAATARATSSSSTRGGRKVTAPCRSRLPCARATTRGTSAEKHGGLPNNGRVIAAVVDLLRTGDTQRLPRTSRAALARARSASHQRGGLASRRAAQGAAGSTCRPTRADACSSRSSRRNSMARSSRPRSSVPTMRGSRQ